MITNTFQDLTLSRLGFGAMRLPMMETDPSKIDEEQVFRMVDYALENGINYFDTAFPYHAGYSEIVLGKALARHPRESFYLATKYPGHQISDSYDPAAIFEEQLKKCGVEYFDFYLLHNVYENSVQTYMDERWGILDYFVKQKEMGRIRHLGFSSHAHPETLEKFLDYCGDRIEFCQIQLNYLDWTLQDAKKKYDLLTERGIPVWVMEPLRGGRLANLSEEEKAVLHELRPEESCIDWAFRFLQGLPNVKMILSGMSAYEQMVQNVETFQTSKPLNEEEMDALMNLAEGMKNAVPCTACRYCCAGCPMQLDIPKLIAAYNDLHFATNLMTVMNLDVLPEDKKASACIGCRKCTKVCPQNIDIPEVMKGLVAEVAKHPTWKDMSEQRAKEAEEIRKSWKA